jgi:hypothetical protein
MKTALLPLLPFAGVALSRAVEPGPIPLRSTAQWQALVRGHGDAVVPATVWDRAWGADRATLVPLIRSVEIPLDRPVQGVTVT